jgi:hypothetical protein
MALALGAGAVFLGTATDRLAGRGIRLEALMTIVAATLIATELALILQLPVPSYLTWSVVAAVGAGTVLSYAIVADYFPTELAGRANGALNVFHLGGAFILQFAIGLILQQWPAANGHYPERAYQIALGAVVVLQILALIWFELPRARQFWAAQSSIAYHKMLDLIGDPPRSRTPYGRAARIWTRRADSASAQAQRWRAAGIGSAILSGLLALALALSTNHSKIVPYVIDLSRIEQARASSPQ